MMMTLTTPSEMSWHVSVRIPALTASLFSVPYYILDLQVL